MESIQTKKALIIVDMQNDFLDGGSLEVKHSTRIIPIINKIREKIHFDTIILTADNHPTNHISFKDSPLLETTQDSDLDVLTREWKGAFPPHCIQGTQGQQIHKDIIRKETDFIVFKGENPLKEEFSGFDNPALDQHLRDLNITDVYVVGVCYDFCVSWTAQDSAANGYKTYVIKDASKELLEDNIIKVEDDFRLKAITLINSYDLL